MYCATLRCETYTDTSGKIFFDAMVTQYLSRKLYWANQISIQHHNPSNITEDRQLTL